MKTEALPPGQEKASLKVKGMMEKGWRCGSCLGFMRPWIRSSAPPKPGVVAHACHPNTQKFKDMGQPGLHEIMLENQKRTFQLNI